MCTVISFVKCTLLLKGLTLQGRKESTKLVIKDVHKVYKTNNTISILSELNRHHIY